jgi:hypothetical protein
MTQIGMIFMTTEKLLQRVDELIEMGNAALRTCYHRSSWKGDWVKGEQMKGFRTASLSFIGRVYGEEHPHFTEFSENTRECRLSNAKWGLGIMKAIRGEIAGGWLFTIKGQVTAEVFTDYMEMAEYLLAEMNCKDPAAVIAGSTLEAHLRQLCIKNGIPVTQPKNGKDVPVKAATLNDELTGAKVYNMADQKQVLAWLDLRNKAAHGDYTAYTREQIEMMVNGVINFIARNAV